MSCSHRPSSLVRRLAGLSIIAMVAITAGCASDDGGRVVVAGNCGLGDNTIDVERVLPMSVLEGLIESGDHQAIGGLIVRDGKLPAAFDGDCAIRETRSGQDALRLGVVNRSDPRYAAAEQLVASGDFRGFERVDDATYVLPLGEHGARGVAILPDRIVIVQVLRPAEGVDVPARMKSAIVEIATRIEDLG